MNIEELVENYKQNRNAYLSSNYNETQLRNEFLDVFFELLGWDVKNTQGKSTFEREVILEEGLRNDKGISIETKKPDYTFRLSNIRKFFVEAKKPSVKIKQDKKPAQQVRRYGFTAKLCISVLSNFEDLMIYDCSKKVEETDTVYTGLVKSYHYTEYVEKFDEIKSLLGQESVYSGNFDLQWVNIEKQIEQYSIDDLFLNQINNWRLSLADVIIKINPNISEESLDNNKTLVSSGGTAGYCMISIPQESPYSIYYIQAILNSKMLEWYSSLQGEIFRGGYIARGTKVLQSLPIKRIDFTNLKETNIHNSIVQHQKKLIDIQKNIDKNTNNHRELELLNSNFTAEYSLLEKDFKKLYDFTDQEYNAIPDIGQMYEA